MAETAPFWEHLTLEEMDDSQWEQLCDGCARCCMIKLQDEDTDEVFYTSMVCDLLNMGTCRCTDYPNRHTRVPDCVVLTPSRATEFGWLPYTCAYRRLAEGRGLADWHPLVSGDPQSVHEAGFSVRGRVVKESAVHPDEHEEMLVTWVHHD